MKIILQFNNLWSDEALIDLTIEAFKVCDKDGTEGLTWEEVAKCEDEFCDLLSIGCTTEEEFNSYDMNQDGNLLIDEVFEYKEKLMEDEEKSDLPLLK